MTPTWELQLLHPHTHMATASSYYCIMYGLLHSHPENTDLNISYDDRVPYSVEEVLSFGISMQNQCHATFGTGQRSKHTLCSAVMISDSMLAC